MIRVGVGFDAHRLVKGRALVLGGERIAHDKGLDGHSDGDALLHAIADAILGTIAAPDIGALFPSSDETLKGVASERFVKEALRLVSEKGFSVQHVDAVVIAQEPKLAPYVPAMRARIAALVGLPEDAVGLKATTTDGMGFTGRGEGIAVQAIATVGP